MLVGSDPGSKYFVGLKSKACAIVGITTSPVELPDNVSQEDLIAAIKKLNSDPTVDGILVQLPLHDKCFTYLAYS